MCDIAMLLNEYYTEEEYEYSSDIRQQHGYEYTIRVHEFKDKINSSSSAKLLLFLVSNKSRSCTAVYVDFSLLCEYVRTSIMFLFGQKRPHKKHCLRERVKHLELQRQY